MDLQGPKWTNVTKTRTGAPSNVDDQGLPLTVSFLVLVIFSTF